MQAKYSTRRELLSRNQVLQVAAFCLIAGRMSTISGGLFKKKYNN
jgi:hypothetical protein